VGRRADQAGVSPIVVYANQDRWLNLGLLTALAKYGDRIKRWDADYDGSSEIPSWADAKQYATGNVDLDAARADFFTGAPPKPAKSFHYERYHKGPERTAVQRYDYWRAKQTSKAHPHRLWMLLRKKQCGVHARRIELAVARAPHDVKDPWDREDRRFRHEQLRERAKGKLVQPS